MDYTKPQTPQSNFFVGLLFVVVALITAHLVIYLLFDNTASAEDKAMFKTPFAKVASWLDDYANQTTFFHWAEANLTQSQLDDLSELIEPAPEPAEVASALESSIAILKAYGITEDSDVVKKLREEISNLPKDGAGDITIDDDLIEVDDFGNTGIGKNK